MKKNKLQRRKFLKLSASSLGILAAFPMEALLNTMITGMLEKAAYGAETEAAMNYVHFNAPGGPARWMFDQFLKPNGEGDPFVNLPHLGNYINPDLSVVYKIVQATNSPYFVNWLWKFPVPKADGSTRPMMDLLNNLLSIRGVRLNGDGHDNNVRLQVQPVVGGPSLTGLVADASSKTFASISYNGNFATSSFKAPGGAANIDLPTTEHPIQFLFSPFTTSSDSFRLNQSLDQLVTAALDNLAGNAKENNLATQYLGKDRAKAEIIFRSNITSFITQYDALLVKYKSLINRSIRETGIEGMNEFSITPIANDPRFKFAYGNVTLTSLKDPLDDFFINAHMDPFASGMAVTEFALINGFSSSIVCGVGPIFNLKLKVNNAEIPNVAMRHDAHDCGSIPITLVHGMWSRGVASCLLELIDQLKMRNPDTYQAANGGPTLFDRTVIHFCGEMGRYPSAGDSGHGWEAQNISLWSGLVERFTVLGNIATKNISYFGQESPGTWGAAAPVPELKNSLVTIDHITTTIATMLGLPPPSRNGTSLVAVTTNGAGKKVITPVISGPKNIPN